VPRVVTVRDVAGRQECGRCLAKPLLRCGAVATAALSPAVCSYSATAGWLLVALSPEVATTAAVGAPPPAAADPSRVVAPFVQAVPDVRTPAACGDPPSPVPASCSAGLPQCRRRQLRPVIYTAAEGPKSSARAVPEEGLSTASWLKVSRTWRFPLDSVLEYFCRATGSKAAITIEKRGCRRHWRRAACSAWIRPCPAVR